MALTAFVVRIVSAAIAFFSQILLARLMGEFEYGIFAFVWVLAVLSGNLSCLGFHTAVIRFLPGYVAQEAAGEIRGLVLAARGAALASASALTVAGVVFLHFFSSYLAPYYVVPIVLVLFTLPMIALGDILDGTARARSWPLAALAPTYIVRPVLILAFMLTAIGFGAPKTAVTAMQAALLATYATTLLQMIALDNRLDSAIARRPRVLHLRLWTRFALPVFLIDGIGFLLTNADVVIVGFYRPPQEVAIYFAAAKTIVLMQFVFFAVKAAAAPKIAAFIAAADQHGLEKFAITAARWTFWPSLGLGVLLLALGPFLLSLFGSAFADGYPLMAMLFCGFLAKAAIGPGETLLNMAGRQTLCIAVYGTILAANLLLNLLLIPLHGLAGAAAATAASMLLESVLLHIAIRRSLKIVLFAFAGATREATQR